MKILSKALALNVIKRRMTLRAKQYLVFEKTISETSNVLD